MSEVVQMVIGGTVALFLLLVGLLKGTQKKLKVEEKKTEDLKEKVEAEEKKAEVAEKKAETEEKKVEVIQQYHEEVDQIEKEGHLKAEEVLKNNAEAMEVYNQAVRKWNIIK